MLFSERPHSGSRTESAETVFRRAVKPERTPSPLLNERTPECKCESLKGRRKQSCRAVCRDPRSETKKASGSFFGFTGSITIEAALVLPLAMFFLLTFFSFFGILRTQIAVQKVMEESLERVALLAVSGAASALPAEGAETAIDLGILEAGVRTGLADMEQVSGVTPLGTDLDPEAGTAKLVVNYGVRLRNAFFPLPTVRMTQVSYRRLWTGAEAAGTDGRDGQIVFVTERGTVYHLSRNCRHLVQHTEMMTWDQLRAARSQDGAIYYPCAYCHPRQSDGRFFVVAYGNRYHSTLTCPELRITVRAVRLDEVGGLPCCSACAAAG